MSWWQNLIDQYLHPTKPPSTPPDRHYSIVVSPKDATVTLQAVGDREIPAFTAVPTVAEPGLDDYQMFTIPGDTPMWGAVLTITAPGYTPYLGSFDLVMNDTAMPPVTLAPVAPPVVATTTANEHGFLKRSGKNLVTEDGLAWQSRGFSSFWLLKMVIEGQDITWALNDALRYPITDIRVFGMLNWPDAKFGPTVSPRYYESLEWLLQQAQARKVRIQFVCLADAQGLSKGQQRSHLATMDDLASRYWCLLLSAGNEWKKNGFDPAELTRPHSVCSVGSPLGDEWPAPPDQWDWAEFHPGRTPDWPRKMKSAREVEDQLKVPCICTEPIGAADTDVPGRRSSVVNDFYDAGVCATLSCTGATFFAESLLRSQPLTPHESECALAFYAGMLSVPADTRHWAYTRGGLADCPVFHDDNLASRTFVQYNGSEAWGIAMQPKPGWSLRVNGWQVASTFGPRGNAFKLVR